MTKDQYMDLKDSTKLGHKCYAFWKEQQESLLCEELSQ